MSSGDCEVGAMQGFDDVQVFLGTIGVCRIFIKNFAHHTHHLVKLTRKGAPFEFGQKQVAAQEDLKEALLASPAL